MLLSGRQNTSVTRLSIGLPNRVTVNLLARHCCNRCNKGLRTHPHSIRREFATTPLSSMDSCCMHKMQCQQPSHSRRVSFRHRPQSMCPQIPNRHEAITTRTSHAMYGSVAKPSRPREHICQPASSFQCMQLLQTGKYLPSELQSVDGCLEAVRLPTGGACQQQANCNCAFTP